MDASDDSCPASLWSQVTRHNDGSISLDSPEVDFSTEVYCQVGEENMLIHEDEGYRSDSNLDSLASFSDSAHSLDSGMSSLESVTAGNESVKSKMACPNDAFNHDASTTSNTAGVETKLPDEAESETELPNTCITVEMGLSQITIPWNWWKFHVHINRISFGSKTKKIVFQIGLKNRLYNNCAGLLTESFECVVKQKDNRIFLCPCCFRFVRFILSKQFTIKIEQMVQAKSFVDSGLAINYETPAFEMSRSGNRSKLVPEKDEALTHIPKCLEMTEKDDVKPKFSASPLNFVHRRPEKQFGGKVIEKTRCTGEMHFDPTRCNFKCFSAAARPRPELHDNENITDVHNYLCWRSVSSNYGENEPYPNQNQETRVIVQEVLSNETIQTKRGVELNKSKKDRGKQSTEAKRSNDQLNVRIRNGEAFERELAIGSSTEDGGFNLSNTPVSDHDDQNSVRSTTVQLRLDDGSIPTSEKSKSYQAGRTKLYHRWLEKTKKVKAKTTGRKQCILQHSDIYRKKCNSLTISKKKKMREVSATDRNTSRSSLKRQVLRRRYHLTNYVKSQVKNRFPKYWLCSGKLDTHFCRIQSKRRQVHLRDVVSKQMRLHLAASRLCRARKSKGAYDFKPKMKAHASCPCSKRSGKEAQTKHTETKPAHAKTKLTRCKIADGLLRSEDLSCFNPQIQMFRKNIGLQSANVSADKKGKHFQKEKDPHGETDFGDIDETKFRTKSLDDSCSPFSQEDIENILFAKLSKLQSDDFKALFGTIGAIYCFSTENGFVCLLRDFDCWTDEEVMKSILKRLVLEKIGPIEIYLGVSISEEEDIDVEFTK